MSDHYYAARHKTNDMMTQQVRLCNISDSIFSLVDEMNSLDRIKNNHWEVDIVDSLGNVIEMNINWKQVKVEVPVISTFVNFHV